MLQYGSPQTLVFGSLDPEGSSTVKDAAFGMWGVGLKVCLAGSLAGPWFLVFTGSHAFNSVAAKALKAIFNRVFGWHIAVRSSEAQ